MTKQEKDKIVQRHRWVLEVGSFPKWAIHTFKVVEDKLELIAYCLEEDSLANHVEENGKMRLYMIGEDNNICKIYEINYVNYKFFPFVDLTYNQDELKEDDLWKEKLVITDFTIQRE